MIRALILAIAVLALCYPAPQHATAQARATEAKAKSVPTLNRDTAAIAENSLARLPKAIETAPADPDAKAQEKRAEDDLKAQQDMAKWAMWMFVAAGLTVLLTMIGILLIWRTLIHTRRASKYAGVGARQARRAAIASDRMAEEATKATLAAVEASKAGQEANRLTRDAQSEARSTAQYEARKAQRREQVAERRAEAALAIAARNADAAAGQLEVAQDTARRQLRAYVGFWEVGIEHIRLPEQNDNGLAFRVRWKIPELRPPATAKFGCT
jgi:hypothetical protein